MYHVYIIMVIIASTYTTINHCQGFLMTSRTCSRHLTQRRCASQQQPSHCSWNRNRKIRFKSLTLNAVDGLDYDNSAPIGKYEGYNRDRDVNIKGGVPVVTVIKSTDDFIDFLSKDDRLCVIKFYGKRIINTSINKMCACKVC